MSARETRFTGQPRTQTYPTRDAQDGAGRTPRIR